MIARDGGCKDCPPPAEDVLDVRDVLRIVPDRKAGSKLRSVYNRDSFPMVFNPDGRLLADFGGKPDRKSARLANGGLVGTVFNRDIGFALTFENKSKTEQPIDLVAEFGSLDILEGAPPPFSAASFGALLNGQPPGAQAAAMAATNRVTRRVRPGTSTEFFPYNPARAAFHVVDVLRILHRGRFLNRMTIRPPTVVAIGDSVTAGMQSLTLSAPRQLRGYAPLFVAEQIHATEPLVTLPLPLIGSPTPRNEDEANLTGNPFPAFITVNGTPTLDLPRFLVPASTLDTPRSNPEVQNYNLAVPGMSAGELLTAFAPPTNSTVADRLLVQILLRCPVGERLTFEASVREPKIQGELLRQRAQVGIARALTPSLVVLWAGNNDFLGLAVGDKDGRINRFSITEPHVFRENFAHVLDEVSRIPGVDVIVGTVPQVDKLPHLMPLNGQPLGQGFFPFRIRTLERSQDFPFLFEQVDLTDFMESRAVPLDLLDGGIAPPGSFTNLSGHVQTMLGQRREPKQLYLNQDRILDPVELSFGLEGIAEGNRTIGELAAARGYPFIDAGAFFDQVPRRGESKPPVVVRGRPVTADLNGGFFSFDGIHPSDLGHELVTNLWIPVLNEEIRIRGSFGGLTQEVAPRADVPVLVPR